MYMYHQCSDHKLYACCVHAASVSDVFCCCHLLGESISSVYHSHVWQRTTTKSWSRVSTSIHDIVQVSKHPHGCVEIHRWAFAT